MLKRRVTPEQRQGKKGQGQVDECFLDLGWEPRPLVPDLGEDFIVDIYQDGVSVGLAFYAQVKSTNDLSKFRLKNGNYSYPIEVKDLNHWRDYSPPVVLILWDTNLRSGYWAAISDIVVQLNDANPGWHERGRKEKGKEPKVQVVVPGQNIINDTTLKSLRRKLAIQAFAAVRHEQPLTIKIDFSFPDDAEGRDQKKAMERFIDYGEGVSIGGKFITGVQLSEWHERKFGKPTINPQGKIVLGKRHSNQIEKYQLTLLSAEGRIKHRENIEVKTVCGGNKQVTVSNEHLPTPFIFKMIYRASGRYSANVSLSGAKTTAGEALRAYKFFDETQNSSFLRIERLGRVGQNQKIHRYQAPIGKKTFPVVNEAFRETLKKLHLIEVKTGVVFTVTDEGIGEADWHAIHEVADVLETGKLKAEFKERTQVQTGACDADMLSFIQSLLSLWRQDEPIEFQATAKESDIEILGVTVPLGPFKMYVKGALSPECAKALEEIEKKRPFPEELKITFVDGEYKQEFCEWLVGASELEAFPKFDNEEDD